MSRVYSVGYTTKLVPNWDKFAPPIKAPSNYGAEAAAKYIEKHKESAQENARWEPLTAQIDSICIVSHLHGGQFKMFSGLDNCLSELELNTSRVYVSKPISFARMLMEASIKRNGGSLPPRSRWLFKFETTGLPVVTGSDAVVIIDPVRAVTGESDITVATALERYTPSAGVGRKISDSIKAMLTDKPPAAPAELAACYMSFFGYMLEG